MMVTKLIHKRLALLLCLGCLGLLWTCKSKDITTDKKYTDDITKLEMLMNEEAYYIDIEVAFPFTTAATQQVANALFLSRTGNNASRIDVSANGHFVQIQNDSVKGDLSFFGERRLNGGNYGGRNGGISFEGLPEHFEKTVNKDKRKLEIEFSINQTGEPSENYDVRIEIFANKHTVVQITSTYKTFMNYTGTLRSVESASQ